MSWAFHHPHPWLIPALLSHHPHSSPPSPATGTTTTTQRQGCCLAFVIFLQLFPAPTHPPTAHRRRFGRPVWLTEFSCPVGSGGNLTVKAGTAISYFRKAAAWLDSQSWVERYAWFALTEDSAAWIGPGSNLEEYGSYNLTRLGMDYNYGTYADAGRVPAAAVLPDWRVGCASCLAAAGTGLGGLPVDEQRHCREDCGVWPAAERATIRRGLRAAQQHQQQEER